MKFTTLFLQKLGIAFLVGALPTLLAFIADVGVNSAADLCPRALLPGGVARSGAGLRAALVLIPGVTYHTV